MLSPVRVVFAAMCVVLMTACGGSASPPPTAGATTSVNAPLTSPPPVATVTAGVALQADPQAEYTLGDTALLAGGELVGDQAELTVEEAVVLSETTADGDAQFAFLVAITGRDAETFPYNLRDFRLIDDQDFQYEPLYEGGSEPRLEFGDLPPDEGVRGWLTFEAPATTTTVELVYSPALALEPAVFGFRVI